MECEPYEIFHKISDKMGYKLIIGTWHEVHLKENDRYSLKEHFYLSLEVNKFFLSLQIAMFSILSAICFPPCNSSYC